MTASLGERAIEAAALLMEAIRTGGGWSTESGALVRRSPVAVGLDADDLYWQTLVYEGREDLSGYNGGPVTKASGRIQVRQQLNVDTFTVADPGRESIQYQAIKADARKALSTASGALSDAAGVICGVEHLGAEFIADVPVMGVIGVRTRIICNYIEAWGNPARAP